MKRSKIFSSLIFSVLMIILFCTSIYAYDYKEVWANNEAMYSFNNFVSQVQKDKSTDISSLRLYPGGMPFGVKIISKGLCVVGFSENEGKNTSVAFSAGVRLGDIIIKANAKDINSIEDYTQELNKNGDKPLTLTVKRGSSTLEFTFVPQYVKDECSYKSGLWLKDSTSGIGTVTFVDPHTGAFGGLGHGICDINTGNLVPLSKGLIMDVTVNGVIKGKIGSAGELKGSFNPKKIGRLTKNSSCGVFGLISLNNDSFPEGPLPVATKNEVKAGDAYIWCTLSDSKPCRYKVQLSDIDVSCTGVKNFRVKIVDPSLLEKTGGIVQGMSGSPIIQNGKLVGAVTHVLINDPTTGYGIFIENMLNAANIPMAKAS